MLFNCAPVNCRGFVLCSTLCSTYVQLMFNLCSTSPAYVQLRVGDRFAENGAKPGDRFAGNGAKQGDRFAGNGAKTLSTKNAKTRFHKKVTKLIS